MGFNSGFKGLKRTCVLVRSCVRTCLRAHTWMGLRAFYLQR